MHLNNCHDQTDKDLIFHEILALKKMKSEKDAICQHCLKMFRNKSVVTRHSKKCKKNINYIYEKLFQDLNSSFSQFSDQQRNNIIQFVNNKVEK